MLTTLEQSRALREAAELLQAAADILHPTEIGAIPGPHSAEVTQASTIVQCLADDLYQIAANLLEPVGV